MGKRKRTSDPGWRERWQVGHDEMARLLERRLERDRELAAQDDARRRRLQRLTFGLLGR